MVRHIMVLALATFLVAGVSVAGEVAWFDWEHCTMCSKMMEYPGLVDNMSEEQHDLSKGIVTITTVNEKYLGDFREASAKMVEVGKELQQGKMVPLCGSCQALGMCMAKGVDSDYVMTSTGSVWILTSDKPEVVAELQAWAKKNAEEMAKMKG